MKHLWVMFAVMGLATTAYGVAIELQFGPGTTGVVDPSGNTVTLTGSDIAQIDVWAVDLSSGLSFWGVGVDVSPPLTNPPDFTYEGSVRGPQVYPPGFVGPSFDGNSFASGYALYVYYHYDTLLFTMYIHCTGQNSQHQIFTNDFGGAAYAADGWVGAHYQGVDFDDSVTIIQVPEPASLALLALGGMALLRRR